MGTGKSWRCSGAVADCVAGRGGWFGGFGGRLEIGGAGRRKLFRHQDMPS
jgi:hypothetical protein